MIEFQRFTKISVQFFCILNARIYDFSLPFSSFTSVNNLKQIMLIFLSRTLYFVFSPPIYFGFISECTLSLAFLDSTSHTQTSIFLSRTSNILWLPSAVFIGAYSSLWYTYYMHSKRIVIAKVLAECRFMVPFPQLFDGTTVRSARLDEINYSGILYSRC